MYPNSSSLYARAVYFLLAPAGEWLGKKFDDFLREKIIKNKGKTKEKRWKKGKKGNFFTILRVKIKCREKRREGKKYFVFGICIPLFYVGGILSMPE